jgi:hypothetical protein
VFDILMTDILAKSGGGEVNFREMMDEARPDVVERQAANVEKGELAMRLRTMRDASGMTI